MHRPRDTVHAQWTSQTSQCENTIFRIHHGLLFVVAPWNLQSIYVNYGQGFHKRGPFSPDNESLNTAHAQLLFPITNVWSSLVIHNSATENCRMTKFGTWARHAKHYENTVKFKWSTEKGHKDMRRSNTKTSNISRQHHLVVKFICRVGNRGRQSKRQVRFFTEISRVAVSVHARWNNAWNSLILLTNRPFMRNLGRWTRRWWQFSDPMQN